MHTSAAGQSGKRPARGQSAESACALRRGTIAARAPASIARREKASSIPRIGPGAIADGRFARGGSRARGGALTRVQMHVTEVVHRYSLGNTFELPAKKVDAACCVPGESTFSSCLERDSKSLVCAAECSCISCMSLHKL